MKSWPELTDNPEAYDCEPRVYNLRQVDRRGFIIGQWAFWIVFFAAVTLVGWWV
jgi:hypothetical protein